MKIKDLAKPLDFTYISPAATDKNFPDDGIRGEIEIITMPGFYEISEALAELKKRGLKPATIHQLLIWAEAEWNKTDWIVAFGSQHQGGVLCLRGDAGWRPLGCGRVERQWGQGCLVAGLRESAGKLGSVPLETLPLELEINGVKYKRV